MQDLNLKLEQIEGNELIIRTGEALPLKPKKAVHLTGTIGSVVDFATKRKTLLEQNRDKVHLVLNRSEMTCLLVVGEDQPDNLTVSAKMQLVDDLKNLGINTGQGYNCKSLAQKLRMSRWLFRSREEQAEVVDRLVKVEMKVNTAFKESDDFRGNTALAKTRNVVSNVPLDFVIKTPIIEGDTPVELNVNIELDVLSDAVALRLVSPDLEAIKRQIIDDQFQRVEEVLSDYVIIRQ